MGFISQPLTGVPSGTSGTSGGGSSTSTSTAYAGSATFTTANETLATIVANILAAANAPATATLQEVEVTCTSGFATLTFASGTRVLAAGGLNMMDFKALNGVAIDLTPTLNVVAPASVTVDIVYIA